MGVSVGVAVGVCVGVGVGVLVDVAVGVMVGVLVGVGVLEALANWACEATSTSGPEKNELKSKPMAGETKALVITTSKPIVIIHQGSLIPFLWIGLAVVEADSGETRGLAVTVAGGCGTGSRRRRLTAQCIPSRARLLLGLTDRAFSR